MTSRRGGIATTVVAFAIIVIAVVAMTGILAIAIPNPNGLAVYGEMCSFTYGPPATYLYLGSRCGTPNHPVSMPTTFNLITIAHNQTGNITTLQEAYFGIFLRSGQAIRVSEDSGVPAEFRVYLYNQTGLDTSDLVNEVAHHAYPVIDDSGSTSDNGCVLASHNEWYLFVLSVDQVRPVATATFDIQLTQANQLNLANLCGFGVAF